MSTSQLAPGDRAHRLGYPVVFVGAEVRRGRRVVSFVTPRNRALWRMSAEEFAARFAADVA